MTSSRRFLAFVVCSTATACSVLLGDQLEVVRCESEGAYGAPACPAAQTCVDGTCLDVGAPPGSPCAFDGECRQPGSCAEVPGIAGGDGKRCVLPCCRSEDCGPSSLGLVCAPIELAAQNACLPVGSLGGTASPGAAEAGAPCVEDAECRSAACRAGRCLDACCRGVDCPRSGDSCRLGNAPWNDANAWQCMELPTGDVGSGPCELDEDCRSGACVLLLDGQRYCAEPCCGSRECGEVVSPANPSLRYRLACSKLNGVRACVRVVDAAAVGEVGETCGTDADCRSGSCLADGDASYCSDFCCDDESCGDVARFACRPLSDNGSWALRCVRR